MKKMPTLNDTWKVVASIRYSMDFAAYETGSCLTSRESYVVLCETLDNFSKKVQWATGIWTEGDTGWWCGHYGIGSYDDGVKNMIERSRRGLVALDADDFKKFKRRKKKKEGVNEK